MAHFAQLDENNIVMQVIVVNNNELLDETGNESEAKGIAFCKQLLGGNNWVQTSYNAKIRKNYASVGYTYFSNIDAFVPPKPFDSWVLDTATAQWQPPTPRPNDTNRYRWDETTLTWIFLGPQLTTE